jgi:hypothetical protein
MEKAMKSLITLVIALMLVSNSFAKDAAVSTKPVAKRHGVARVVKHVKNLFRADAPGTYPTDYNVGG